jgi:hypothetical protein
MTHPRQELALGLVGLDSLITSVFGRLPSLLGFNLRQLSSGLRLLYYSVGLFQPPSIL